MEKPEAQPDRTSPTVGGGRRERQSIELPIYGLWFTPFAGALTLHLVVNAGGDAEDDHEERGNAADHRDQEQDHQTGLDDARDQIHRPPCLR